MFIRFARYAGLTIFAFHSLTLLGAAAKPLVQPVTVIHQQTVAFKITTEVVPPLPGQPNARPTERAYLMYRDEDGIYQRLPESGDSFSACFQPTARRAAFSFDNDTAQTWTIRLLPLPGSSQKGLCHELECASNLQELKSKASLCDLSADGSADCVTSAAGLGACFGPECNVARAMCTNKLDANRTCAVKVADVIAACNAASCATAREVGAKKTLPPNLLNRFTQASEYTRSANVIVVPPRAAPNQQTARETFPSAGFEPEVLPEAGPYNFRLEPSTGDVLKLEVTAAPPVGGCTIVPTVRERTTQNAAVVPLDNTGVASWVYLNPRNPACLRCDGQALLPLAFYNRTSDRSFSVTIDLPAEVIPHLGDFERANCTAGQPCKVTRTVQPNNATIFGIDILQAIPEGTPLKFQVGFYDETEKPANPAAFIRISGKVTEPEGALQTAIAATVGGILDPFFAALPDKITDEKTLNDDGELVDGPDGRDDATGFKPCYVMPKDYAKAADPRAVRRQSCLRRRVRTPLRGFGTSGSFEDARKPR